MPLATRADWERFLKKHPEAHILQTALWGDLKSKYGWKRKYIIHSESGAQVLLRKLPLGLTVAYIPKGPIGNYSETLLSEIVTLGVQEKAFVIYIEPDLWDKESTPDVYGALGFSLEDFTIQPRQTICLSLKGDEELWRKRMKQVTRYNIGKAVKKEVIVEQSDDVDAFCELMKITGSRNVFGIHSPDYYHNAYNLFSKSGNCILYLAKYDGEVLAGIMPFMYGNRAWYFYGASNNKERNRMPTYLLQWETMRWAASHGCETYDLWGIPDEKMETLEAEFKNRSGGLWGVYRFKRGFGGEIRRSMGVYQKVLSKPVFAAYSLLMKFRKSQIV